MIRAMGLYNPIHSLHEAVAVIEEEFIEVKCLTYWPKHELTKNSPYQEVRGMTPDKIRDAQYEQLENEYIQLSAMGVRAILDVIDKEEFHGRKEND